MATSKSRDMSFLFGFGHSGLLFEGLDFSDYRTNASEFEKMHLLAVLSSGGTGERMWTMILSLRLCRPCHPSKRRCERWHVLGLLDSP